ncbi:hypothetical protein EMIT047CA2_90203 [Pseudomonas soli]
MRLHQPEKVGAVAVRQDAFSFTSLWVMSLLGGEVKGLIQFWLKDPRRNPGEVQPSPESAASGSHSPSWPAVVY